MKRGIIALCCLCAAGGAATQHLFERSLTMFDFLGGAVAGPSGRQIEYAFERVASEFNEIEKRLRKLEERPSIRCQFDALSQQQLQFVRQDMEKLKALCEPLRIAVVVEEAWAKARLLREEAGKADPNAVGNRLKGLADAKGDPNIPPPRQ